MINKKTFGSFIREKRNEKGFTQKELAEILFLSESAISKWEMGKSYPDITLIPDLCRVLDVSEHELIGGATDTEYRKIKEEARLYRKISETFFWGFTLCYIAAFIITLICDICINRKITYSLTVFASLLSAFTFIPSCIRFSEKNKLPVFIISTFLSVNFLFFICCIQYGQIWFPVSFSGILLGYCVIFGYSLLKRYINETHRKIITIVYFSVCFILTLILICSVRLVYVFSLKSGMLIALYAFMPFAFTGLINLTQLNRKFRISADITVFGIAVYFCQYTVGKILDIQTQADYITDFTDWGNCTNGNIYLTVLILAVTVSAVIFTFGIKEKKKNNNRK